MRYRVKPFGSIKRGGIKENRTKYPVPSCFVRAPNTTLLQRRNIFSFDLTNLPSEWQIYFWAIGSNFILRCSWTYKLSAHLRHNYLTVFTITLLEMLRRFQWVFFRVENEWNKITRSGIQLTEIPKEEEKLLGSNIHDV